METSAQISPKHTWKPIAGGILSIIAGVINLFFGFTVALFVGSGYFMQNYPAEFRGYEMMFQNFGVGIGIVFIILGIVSVIGGIFALRRRVWGLALAGAITALMPHPGAILGLLAVIFISISRKEFDWHAPPVFPGKDLPPTPPPTT